MPHEKIDRGIYVQSGLFISPRLRLCFGKEVATSVIRVCFVPQTPERETPDPRKFLQFTVRSAYIYEGHNTRLPVAACTVLRCVLSRKRFCGSDSSFSYTPVFDSSHQPRAYPKHRSIMAGGVKKPVNIFRLGNLGEPDGVFNWRLWFAVVSFGLLGAARGIDEGLISGAFNSPDFQSTIDYKSFSAVEQANIKANVSAMVQIGSVAGALM